MAAVRLLARVCPHVLLELGRVAKALSALCANVCKVFAVHGQQVAVEQALLSRLVFAVLALVKFGFLITQDQLVGAERARLPVVPRVLRVLRDFLVLDDELVALQVVVKADLLISSEIAVCTLVLLLKHVVRVVLHVPLQEPA